MSSLILVAFPAGEPRFAQADHHLHRRQNHRQTRDKSHERADGHLALDREDRATGDDERSDGLRADVGERAKNRAHPRLIDAAAREVAAAAVEQLLSLFFFAKAAHEAERGNKFARGAGEFFLREAGFVVGDLELRKKAPLRERPHGQRQHEDRREPPIQKRQHQKHSRAVQNHGQELVQHRVQQRFDFLRIERVF